MSELEELKKRVEALERKNQPMEPKPPLVMVTTRRKLPPLPKESPECDNYACPGSRLRKMGRRMRKLGRQSVNQGYIHTFVCDVCGRSRDFFEPNPGAQVELIGGRYLLKPREV